MTNKKPWICASILCLTMLMPTYALADEIAVTAAGTADTVAETTESVKATGELRTVNGIVYYYVNGKKQKNRWATIDNKTYYFNKNGKAVTGSAKIGSSYYIFSVKGRLYAPKKITVVTINKVKYQVKPSGKAATGWSADKNYLFDKKGKAYTGTIVYKGKFYNFSSNGKKNASRTKKLQKAAVYEKSMTSLYKLIGQPKKKQYVMGCYAYYDPKTKKTVNGKDGILTYKNFKVYTFKGNNGKEYFMDAE